MTTTPGPEARSLDAILRQAYQQAKSSQPDIATRFAYSNAPSAVIDAYRSGYEAARDEMLDLLLEIATNAGVAL